MESFIKIGQTKYVVRITPAPGEVTAGYGPFVVRASSRVAAIAFVKRNWPVRWARGFTAAPVRRDIASSLQEAFA